MIKKIISILFICLLPLSVYSFSDREAFELLSQKSKEAKQFPFHVYVKNNAYAPPDYGNFQGVALPVSSYPFFAHVYEELKDAKSEDEIFATYRFSQGTRWKCFLLRVPGIYAVEAMDIWIFDTERQLWQKPLRIAESWGDAGYETDMQAWIEDINKDGWLDVVLRIMESDTDFEDSKRPTTTKTQSVIYVWDKDHFIDGSKVYLPSLDLKMYRFIEKGWK